MADDVSGEYLKTVTPLSNEEFLAKHAEVSASATEDINVPPINVTAPRLPDDGSLDDNGDPIVIPAAQPTAITGGSATDINQGHVGGDVHGVAGYAGDIAGGVATGVVDGGHEIIKTLGNISDFLAPDAWTKDPEYFTKMAEKVSPKMTPEGYAEVGLKVPTTVAGNLTKGVAQFMTGFVPALKAMRGIKAIETVGTGVIPAIKSMAGTTAAANTAMAAMFDPFEKRLSNLAIDSKIPGMDNALTQWLKADKEDPELLARVKQAAEGHILGKVLEPFIAMLGVFKKAKVAYAEEHGLNPPKQDTAAYTTNPATGEAVDVTPQLGKDNSRFTLENPSIIVPDEATQKAFATDYLDGNYEGAASKASGLVNLKYLNTEEGIRDMIEGFALVKNQAIEKNVRGWTEAAKAAGKLSPDAIPEAAARVQGLDSFVIKAEETRAAVAYKVRDLAHMARANPSKLTQAEFEDGLHKLLVIDTMTTGTKSEIARAMKATQRPVFGGDISKDILATIKDFGNSKGSNNWQLMAEMVSNLPDSNSVTRIAKAASLPNWRDAAIEVYINAMFSPLTFVVNASSNSLSLGGSVLERYRGALGNNISGTGELTFREANQYALGMAKGISDGVAAFSKSWRSNAPIMGQEAKFIDSGHTTALSGATFGITDGASPMMFKLGKAIDLAGIGLRSMPGGTRSLMATDEFFKAMFYRGELGALAQREATKLGLKAGTPEYLAKIQEIHAGAATSKVGDPYHGIKLMAEESAARSTFTEALGEGGEKMIEGFRLMPGSYIIAPFTKTPINLVKYQARRTPGLAGFSDYMQAELNAGGARADLAEAQLGLGSMYLTAGLVLASGGYFNGAITSNFAAQRNLTQLGVEQQAYTDPITGEQTALGRLDGNPISFLLFSATVHETVQAYIAANAEEMAPEELEDGIMHILAIPIGVGAKLAISKTWSQGIAQALDALQKDTEGNYIQKALGNTLPAGGTMKWANKQFYDPYLREASGALEEIQSKIPGMSRTLPPVPDLLGNPSTAKQFGETGLDPAARTKPRTEPVMVELRRLQLQEPNKVILGGATRVLDDVKLDGVEKWNFMQFVRQLKDSDGKDLVDTLDEVINSNDYKDPKMTDAKRSNVLTDIYNKRKDLAKKALQYDSLLFSQGSERPYAKEYDLYDYKRITPLASKVGTKAYTKANALFGDVGMSRQDFIDKRNDEIVKSNLGEALFK